MFGWVNRLFSKKTQENRVSFDVEDGFIPIMVNGEEFMVDIYEFQIQWTNEMSKVIKEIAKDDNSVIDMYGPFAREFLLDFLKRTQEQLPLSCLGALKIINFLNTKVNEEKKAEGDSNRQG